MRVSPAHTTSATRSPTANESVLAMRSGSQPTAWAASSTVALEVSNSKTSPSRPYPARYLFALSNDMAPLLSILPFENDRGFMRHPSSVLLLARRASHIHSAITAHPTTSISMPMALPSNMPFMNSGMFTNRPTWYNAPMPM